MILHGGDMLSDRVRDFIYQEDSPDHFDMSAEESAEAEQSRRLAEVIVDRIISSRERLANWNLPEIEQVVSQMPETIEYLLNERFTKDLVAGVHDYVRRLMKLSRLEGKEVASQVTSTYLQEAVRTYVFGLPLASIALSRAALEQAVKERMNYQGKRQSVGLSELLDEAETAHVIRDKTVGSMAREVAKTANDVLHQKPATIAEAYEMLIKLRGVLQHLYEGD
jgi:hypothetical protein